MAQNVTCCTQSTISYDFEIRSGVRQGCVLLPILFLLVLGEVFHAALPRGRGAVQWTMTFSLNTWTTLTFVYSLVGSWTLTKWGKWSWTEDKWQQNLLSGSQCDGSSHSPYMYWWAQHRRRRWICIYRKCGFRRRWYRTGLRLRCLVFQDSVSDFL